MPWSDKDKHGEDTPLKYVFHITDSKAGYTDYNQGNTCLLILEGSRQTDDRDLVDHHMWISAGAFVPADSSGDTFVHESGDEELRFHPNSKIQQFIESALDAGVPLEERGISSLDASMWKGLSLEIEEVRKNADINGENRQWRQPVVTKFLGTFEGEPEYVDASKVEASASAPF